MSRLRACSIGPISGGCFTAIVAPDGTLLGEPLRSGEGVVVADLDFALIDKRKQLMDSRGHYSRPELLSLLIDHAFQEEWEKYLEQTRTHVQIMRGLFEAFGLDPETITPGRAVVRHIGEFLFKTMEMALQGGSQLGVARGCEQGAQGR